MTSTTKSRRSKKRTGRPPLPARARKGVNLTFRARGDMREWLGARAERSGRSISEEIEQMLEFHRKGEDLVLRVLGGPGTSRIIEPLLRYFGSLEQAGIDWMQDPQRTKLVKEGVDLIIDAVRADQPLPLKEWMPRIIYGNPEDSRLGDEILGRAVAVLQSLGLAEIGEAFSERGPNP